MIADLDEHDGEELPEYDLCVVGSGAAGGVLAAELAATGLRVCVLESGRARTTRHGDRLREVRSRGIHVKDYSRERVLGGASTTWAGLSSPFDVIDVEPRPWLAHSGWPIERDELLDWYGHAAERYRFPPLSFFGEEGLGALRAKSELQPTWTRLEEKVFLAAEEPQNFGRELVATYERENVDLWFDATVTHLETDGTERRVRSALLRSRGGAERRVKARVFVLGAGGIENVRLLLNSRDLDAQGLGNARDQVGRYFMNHPKNYFGTLELSETVEEAPYFFGCIYKGYAGYGGIRFREDVQRERGLVNSYIRLEPLFPWSDNDGVESLVLFVKRTKFILQFWRKAQSDEVVQLRDYSETGDDSDLQNERKSILGWLGLGVRVLVNLPSVLSYVYHRVSKAKPKIRRVRLRNFMEMEPVPENRVVLSEEKDVYGTPLADVHHDVTEIDRRSMHELHTALGEELAAQGLATLEGDLSDAKPWPIDLDASHHMGGTRMGTDPTTSVVDPNCRVHDVENLFVAGASVFPTSGCCNPTFTLVALSIRLADHLRSEVFAESTR